MEPDGRVVRRDQAGDTVSEGQAYAMLLAAAVGDRPAFDRAWGWAKRNLQRPDGLLAWLWANGRVQNPEPAADADIDAARALLVAAHRFGDGGLRAEAGRIAAAVLAHETLGTDTGPVVMAGPWAVRDRRYVNPSYFSPRAFALLGQATSAAAWGRVAEAAYAVTAALMRGDPPLPPDWAVLGDGGQVDAAGAPGDGGAGPQYGMDAVRVPIRFAEDCDQRGRDLSARLWPFLGSQAEDARLSASYGLEGRPAADYEHPASLAGAAGAASAAGDHQAAAGLLERAERLEADHPGYYGAAWVALGRILLTTDLLGGC